MNAPKHLLASPLTLELATVAPHPEAGRPYSRTLIESHEEVEVVLARWSHGVATAPHDHGGATGYVIYVEGVFRERRFRWSNDELRVDAEHVIHSPALVHVTAGDIHDVELLEGAGLSLHFYFGDTTRFRMFDCVHRRTITVSGGGAWLAVDRKHWEEVRPWD
jgi:predicted metal-dependent enzyme (double-stranded beta helix superfamily)